MQDPSPEVVPAKLEISGNRKVIVGVTVFLAVVLSPFCASVFLLYSVISLRPQVSFILSSLALSIKGQCDNETEWCPDDAAGYTLEWLRLFLEKQKKLLFFFLSFFNCFFFSYFLIHILNVTLTQTVICMCVSRLQYCMGVLGRSDDYSSRSAHRLLPGLRLLRECSQAPQRCHRGKP